MTDILQQSFAEIENKLFDKAPKSLYQPIVYAMQSGGKKIRPLLMMYACDLFGGESKDAVKAAYAVELFHNFTLLHDDIMDNALTRRGRDSVYHKYGLTTGILSGDVMMMYAQQLLLDYDKSVSQLFMQTAIEICEGQQMDMDFEERDKVADEEYIEMIRLKTAVLLACSLQIGAMIAGANKVEQEKIYQFGIEIGIAFQLQDDYLDAFGEKAKVGKVIGGDIVENKKTILWIKALEKASSTQISTINTWSEITAYNATKIQEVKDIFVATGSQAYCKELMLDYYAKSIRILDTIDVNATLKMPLQTLADMIVKRAS